MNRFGDPLFISRTNVTSQISSLTLALLGFSERWVHPTLYDCPLVERVDSGEYL